MYRNKASISDYYRAFLKSLEDFIINSDDNYIINTETSQIVSDLILKSENNLTPIEFDSTRKETMRHQKEMRVVPAQRRDDFYRGDGDTQFEFETIFVTIPIVTNSTVNVIKDLGTSTMSMSWNPHDFNWSHDTVTLSMDVKGYGFKHEDQTIVNEISNLKKHLKEWVEWVNSDIKKGVDMVQKELSPFIENRKKKLSEDGERLNSLSEKMGMDLE